MPPSSTSPAETPVAAIYGDILGRAATFAAHRPYLVVNMVSSADGVITLGGLSGGLSSSADKEVFFFLRSLADVILVGASTVRAENYGRPRLAPEVVAERERRGQTAVPRIAVVTRSMKLDWSGRLFASESGEPQPPRTCVLCPSLVPATELAAAEGVADVIIAGESEVDLAEGLGALRAQGARVVLCEGGPTLNGHLFSAGLADELCLTVAPALVGGAGGRISGWTQSREPLPLELLTIAQAQDVLLLRYAVKDALQD
jgi:riboflavin biosynthesis pyrimidine reductase